MPPRRFPRWESYRCQRCGSYRKIPRMDRLREKGHPKLMFCAGCQRVAFFRKV